ncbi:hypothetical protein [Fodinicola feengrottensis]|uniref:hypothetical protein n=1 Tax=Fodinicola feengrottensis TaxID=435914 RepID=UPI0024427360|nr:hypothetical protein [Fodinicola feengrottensis]
MTALAAAAAPTQVATALLTATAPAQATTALLAGTARPTVAWGVCPPDIAAEPGGDALRCGSISVPLDYRNPQGRQISVAVSKLPAIAGGQRRVVSCC